MAAAFSLLLLAGALPHAASARPLLARKLLDAVSSPPAPQGPCYSRMGYQYGHRADGSATPDMTVSAAPAPCSPSTEARGISIFTLIWVVAGGLCLILLARIVRLRLLSPAAQAAAASGGGGGGAAPSAEPSWKVRYGVRVQQPDGAWVAGLEASLRAGLAHTASAVRRTAESLRGGRFTPGSSMHNATELLAMAMARPAADGVTLPPENWPGWRPAADVHAAQVPPSLAALHDAAAAAAAQAAPAAAALAAEEEGRAGAEGSAAQQQATRPDAGPS